MNIMERIIELFRKNAYKIKFVCMNCNKTFTKNILSGIEAHSANMPFGVYLWKDGYFDLDGKETETAQYIECPRCHAKKVVMKL